MYSRNPPPSLSPFISSLSGDEISEMTSQSPPFTNKLRPLTELRGKLSLKAVRTALVSEVFPMAAFESRDCSGKLGAHDAKLCGLISHPTPERIRKCNSEYVEA